MLRLQSFVSDLGQKLKGKVWLLVTGQQKLEEGGDQSVLGATIGLDGVPHQVVRVDGTIHDNELRKDRQTWWLSDEHAGLTVLGPRLPGHGTRWQDLNLTDRKSVV